MKLVKIFLFFTIGLFFYANISHANTPQVNSNLQKLLDNFRVSSGVPAAVLSIYSANEKIITFTSGTIKLKSPTDLYSREVTSHNLFQIGSITKSFTAAVILRLESEGKLSINDTISDITLRYGQWLSHHEYEVWKNVSIKQLLNMTSGIFDVIEDKNFMNILATHPEKTWTPKEILSYADRHQPYFLPGKGWHYSNTNYNILELLIEKVTKHSFTDEINQLIQKKASLKNTYYLPYLYPEYIMKKMAHGYVFTDLDGGFSPPMRSGSDMTAFNMSAAGASGAIVANSIDITKWVHTLFEGHILPANQLNEMLNAVCMGNDKLCTPGEPLTDDSHSQGFSLGLARMYDPQLGILWIYVGSTPGYYSSLIWLPEKHIALALTVNATNAKSRQLLRTLVNAAKLAES